jgi:hypothetical protein
MQRIAVPMIGGRVSSTVLTLIVIPAVYALIKGWGVVAAAGIGTRSSRLEQRLFSWYRKYHWLFWQHRSYAETSPAVLEGATNQKRERPPWMT